MARKRLGKSQSSELQIYLPLDSDTERDYRHARMLGALEEVDLLEMIYELKHSGLAEDRPLLIAAQQELERRGE